MTLNFSDFYLALKDTKGWPPYWRLIATILYPGPISIALAVGLTGI
jgi:hypothetical protein